MSATRIDPAHAVLQQVSQLVAELQPGRPVSVFGHSHLERDLAIDSLARVELLARIERALGVHLSDKVAVEVERVEDLFAAVRAAEGTGGALRTDKIDMPSAGTQQLPVSATTLVEMLDWHAEHDPDRVQIWLYDEEVTEAREITFSGLVDLAERVAQGLVERGIQRGDAVAIMLPTGREFLASFFGILYAGAVPVPLYPPARPSQLEEHLRRQASILQTARTPIMITLPEAMRLGGFLRSQAPALRELVLAADLLKSEPRKTRPAINGDDTAFLQFTSGSTGNPKGVVLSHANLLANIRTIGGFVGPTPEDVFVSWLPLYHDMGLIGAVLTTYYHAVPLVLMSPLAFLRRPERWLWAMHRHGGSLSAAPNFSYAMCAKKLPEEALRGLDLSRWRMTLNGAEQISPEAMNAFAERLAPYGYRPETMTPCYGLAECSLATTMTPLPRVPQVDRVARSFMEDGRATPSDADDALEFVSCGPALRGHEVRIVDSAGRELEERRQGRIQFRGPSATAGYFDSPEATAKLVVGDGWLDSGDLGYLAGGELYVTGRIKDVIIRAGRNVYPHELEEVVGDLAGVRKGCVAVFGARSDQGTESLVVLAETRVEGAAERADLERRIREASADLLGTPAEHVVLAPPGTVLKTSSGKVRRAACRQLYEEGRLLGGLPPWVQFARLSAIGLVQSARERVRSARQTYQAGRFWGAFAPAYAATWGLVASLPTLSLRWRAAHAGARAHLRGAKIPLSVSGLEHLEFDGPAVLVCNHASYLDGIVAAAALPEPVSVVVKRELSEQAIPRVLLEGLDAIFVERFDRSASAADASQVGDALRAGKRVLIFPEGTCLRMPGLLPFHMGAFLAAAQAGVPVVPMTLRGTRDVLRPDQWFPRRGSVEVELAAAIHPQGQDFAAAVALRDAARAVILDACGEPDLGSEDVRGHLGR